MGMVQSNTITRFVAREVGIAGKNNMEMAQCDLIAEFCSDMTEAALSIHPFFMAKNATKENRAKFKGKLDNFIKTMEKLLFENGGEWMVGKGFTWADLYVAVVLNQWAKKMAGIDPETSKLMTLSKRV